ncbi:MAG TPA: class I SAM-dependent rRNA methyltransferase [Geminicoccaceae bacterium]|nr:class I SAM-dependent rRNA methyltransferase [Geminicoccaceae bacterium]
MTYPSIRILPGRDRRFRGGSPWLYSNEIDMDTAAKTVEPGAVARIMTPNGKILGVAHFNPHSLIAARLLTRNKDAQIDRAYFQRRIARALALRERLFDRPFYRLLHGEADGLPGLVVDRFGEALVVQINTAGMQRMAALIGEALEAAVRPKTLLMKGDAPVRQLEGLEEEVELVRGDLPERVEVEENGLVFTADLREGQKTGWYYDQRENRAFAARLAHGLGVLDLYGYAGAFGLTAAAAGATDVLAVDRSEAGLDLARASAERQGVVERFAARRSDAFAALDELQGAKRRFGLVIADPPPFVKSKKDLGPGLKGYEKLARMAAAVVAEPGFLCISCCSHNVPEDQFLGAVWEGVKDAGRGGRLVHRAGAGPDHPVHPALPETAYLKFLALALD